MSFPKNLYELPRKLLGFHNMLAYRPRPARSSIEDRLAALEAESEVRNLLNRYAYAYDAGELDDMQRIYADDCLLINRHGTFVGPEAIRANYRRGIDSNSRSFHHLSDVEIRIEPGNLEAWSTGYIHNLTIKDGKASGAMASCVFHLRRTDGEWKVHECRVVVSNNHDFLDHTAADHTKKPTPTRPETVADYVDL